MVKQQINKYNLPHLKIFGCKTYEYIDKQKRVKSDEKAQKKNLTDRTTDPKCTKFTLNERMPQFQEPLSY